jgi:16S rRNA (guanine966-N2)-methyltransferase
VDRCRVLNLPAERAFRTLERQHASFDLIFLDPPYGLGWVERALTIVAQASLLREDGVIVAEHSVRDRPGDHYGELALYDRRRYGDTVLSFYRWQREKNSNPRNPANGT